MLRKAAFVGLTTAAFWGNVATADNLGDYYNFGLKTLQYEKNMRALERPSDNPNCFGEGVSALAKHYGALNAAAAALGYSSVQALQKAVLEYCRR